MSDELRLNSFLIEIGFSVCLGLAATQILHHTKLDKAELFLDRMLSTLSYLPSPTPSVLVRQRQSSLSSNFYNDHYPLPGLAQSFCFEKY